MDENSPRLPTDFAIDEDNLETAKLSQFNFRRPPSPSMKGETCFEPRFKDINKETSSDDEKDGSGGYGGKRDPFKNGLESRKNK